MKHSDLPPEVRARVAAQLPKRAKRARGMNRFVVDIPVHTVSEANAHTHWRARQRRAKAQRLMVFAFMREYDRLLKNILPCVVTLTRIAPRALDSDNLAGSQKAVRDEVAAALGIDDRDARCEWRYAQRRGEPKEYAVEVTIESKDEPDGPEARR